MIPANIDYVALVRDLNSWGYGPQKIELICGYADGYVAHLMAGNYRDMTYQRAARLYNFWWEERDARGLNTVVMLASPFTASENNQYLVATT